MEFDTTVITFGLPILLRGLVNTVLFCAVSILVGLVLATSVALARVSRRRVSLICRARSRRPSPMSIT